MIDPDDYLLDVGDFALARIGSESVVRWLAQVGASRDWNERMGVAWNLENIHFYLKTAIGRILKENGYTTSWLSKDHNVPAFVASQSGPFDNWPTGQGFDNLYWLPYRKFMIHAAVVNSYWPHAVPLCS